MNNKFNESRRMMIENGYTISEGGSWIDEERGQVYVSSVESYGPASYGHPKAEISYNVETGWFTGNFDKQQHNFARKEAA